MDKNQEKEATNRFSTMENVEKMHDMCINFIITKNLTFELPIVKNELDLTIGSSKVIKISIMKLIIVNTRGVS